MQVKHGVENAHVVMNLLIDHGAIERIGLAEDERAGQEILNQSSLWNNMVKLLCNAPSGPVEMTRRGQNTNIWPWGYDPPEALLSAVRHCNSFLQESETATTSLQNICSLPVTFRLSQSHSSACSVPLHNKGSLFYLSS